MRWIKRKYKREKLPPREVIRFLFLPKTLDGETRWMEIVKIQQHVVEKKGGYYWQSIKFIN